ncbi:MAG: cyclic nucleotide-binding domain-containing protein, partial [Gammaproteobacteria bacterium]|nr:cyclic nucleotide-binding domain-containing protein [Gammaproteobacteria bacterium]
MNDSVKSSVDDALLARFVPINGIAPAHLKELRDHAEIVAVEEGKPIDLGHTRSPHTLYLIDGEIQIVSGSRVIDTIFARTEKARFSLSHMTDEKRTLKAGTRVKLLKLERAKISTLLIWSQSQPEEAPEEKAEKSARPSAKPVPVAEPIILSSEIFSRIPPANVQRIRDVMESVKVTAGDVVVEQGAPGDYYYVIRSGRCKVLRQMAEGDEPVELAELHEGDTFGEEALISESKRNASVVMTTDGELLRLTKENFIELIRDPLLNSVDFAGAQKKVSAGGKLVDVRLPEEHENDGIPGSVNIPLSELRRRMRELRRTRPYVVYCTSGKRSAAAAFLLRERGYDASVLEGGIYALKDAPEKPVGSGAGAPAEVPGSEDAAALQAQLVSVNQQFEQALQHKVELEAARRMAAPGAGAGGADPDSQAEQLDERARQASEEFERAKRQKMDIETRLRETEARAAGERKKAESVVQKLRQQAEERLRKEDERLKHEYSEAAKKIDHIRKAKEEVEAKFQREKERLETELANAQEAIASEASKVQMDLKSAQEVAEKRAATIREKQAEEEQRLRAALEERLREERRRLESEFAETAAAQEKARLTLEAAENARTLAKQESERIAKELKAAQEKRRADEAARIEKERKRLDDEAAKARAKLEAAEKAKMELSTATMKYEEIMAGIRKEEEKLAKERKESSAEQKLRAELDAHNAAMKAAEDEITAAMQAKSEADMAKAKVEEKVATQQAVEEELRVQLYEEMEAWLDQERNRSEEEVEAARRIALEQAERERKKAEERAQQAARTAELLSDVG